ncbi:VWA domain-containing protein [Persicirhabdus sediminis]|uniref:VWA domain-containing protein n=1 Tax=Persicirhabdus sediminis TaxID=454144 RepID=A0A8J7ME83_9BACT|nr:VWA domain-containing protein [Persicirhabdus sediminis]MBK1792279.1 VWA domain-containing protein [Persicirhabdus sediminis]
MIDSALAFHFIRPWFFLLLPVAAVVWWLLSQLDDPLRPWRRVMDAELLQAVTMGNDGFRLRYRMLLALVWLLMVVAIAGPTWKPEPTPFSQDTAAVMLLLKADKTMDLTDLSPSRMELARLKARDFASARAGQPLGLIAYAGSSHLVLPATRDTDVVADMAAEISPAIMPAEGDDLLAAIQLADNTLGQASGSVVIIADTVDTTQLVAMKEFVKSSKLSIFILAIARQDTPEAESLEAAAKALAAELEYFDPAGGEVKKLVKTSAKPPVSAAGENESIRWSEAGWYLVWPICLLSLLAFWREKDIESEEVEG